MEYIGEHLLIGKIGNVFVILSFVAALVASISYFFAARDNEETTAWKSFAKNAFLLHGFSVIGIVVTLFIMLYNHYFEYEYVWHHSNKEMQMKYILSCFWEGQEGSFLLWTFWHVVIGFILQRTAKNWEAPVMSVLSLVQVFLASMLLGITVFEHRIGSNPFTVLLRNHPNFENIPIFNNPAYLEKLNGKGLNPLLQNYWMTIHPPTLFLGFALTVVPFAFAIGGLWKKDFIGWIKPALPWTFLGIAILGTGILMGGAWAYEALSCGGFWAWDPVENASLVPWLTLVGAAHVMLVNKTKGQSLFITFGLSIITFILILYSTFLTRSGILGETSVHAFTDNGMSGQLLIYLYFFLALGLILLFVNVKHFLKKTAEEGLWSREFWMFVGAIILLGSSFQIMFTTSIPVWNKIFDPVKKMAPPSNIIEHYNTWQIPFAFIITLLIAVVQYFKYKQTDLREFFKRLAISFFASILLTALFAYGLHLTRAHYILLMFSTLFATIANANYAVTVLQGKIKKAGASIAHIGFALVLLGSLISTSKKQTISVDRSGIDIRSLGEKISSKENIMLKQGDTVSMGDYEVTYTGKRFEGINVFFDVDYFSKEKDGKLNKQFTLSPRIQTNPNPEMGNVAEPDTRHFPTFDVYTHVTYAILDNPKDKKAEPLDEYAAAKKYDMKKGDTIFSTNAIIILDSLSVHFDKTNYHLKANDIAVKANLRVVDIGKTYTANPVFIIRDNVIQTPEPVKIDPLGLQFMFWQIKPEHSTVEISLQEKKENKKDFIIMQAFIFPYINILWIGCIVMVIGTLLAIVERLKRNV
jgi:cytochrome c-type biogenesis protein CcmF